MVGNIAHFNWKEASCDRDGKSSWMPIMGIWNNIIGGLIALFGTFTKNITTLEQGTLILGIGALYFGIRKIVNGKPTMEETTTETPDDTTKTTIEQTTVTNTQ